METKIIWYVNLLLTTCIFANISAILLEVNYRVSIILYLVSALIVIMVGGYIEDERERVEDHDKDR